MNTLITAKSSTAVKYPQQTLQDFAKDSLFTYGSYVVEQRAIPEFRDGLKPVHRATLWAMCDLNLHHNGPYKKAAKVVGETMGNYHPHSDSSIYESLVGLVNSATPLIAGYGNFGDHSSPPGASRYCFIGSTRVMTDSGLIKLSDVPALCSEYEIEDSSRLLVSENTHVPINTKVSSLKSKKQATVWVNSGKHTTLKITTNYGNCIQCTPNQPLYVLTQNGFCWKEAQDLRLGDSVCMKRGTDCIVKANKLLPEFDMSMVPHRATVYPLSYFPSCMSTDLAFVLGALVSEGAGGHYGVYFSNSNRTFYGAFVDAWKKIFDSRIKTTQEFRHPSPDGLQVKTCKAFIANYAVMRLWFENLGVCFGSYNQVVPEVIFQANKQEVAAFLQALFEGDGSITADKGKIRISYWSVSKQLVEDVQQLLLNYFGIVSTIREDLIRKAFILSVTRLSNVELFANEIGFVSIKKSKRLTQAVCTAIEASKYRNSKGGSIHGMPKDFLVEARESFLRKYYAPGKPHRDEFGGYDTAGKHRLFIKLPNDVDNFQQHVYSHYGLASQHWPTMANKLLDVASRNYVYGYIKSIETMEEPEWVYDLTVPSTHAFVANGVISHNTECKLSVLSDLVLLDKDYLEVIPMMDNYSNDRKIPLYLPAKLPVALLIGNFGIAFGVAASCPSFDLEGVIALTKRAIAFVTNEDTNPITATECANTLSFSFKFGGNCVSSLQDISQFMKKGKGTLQFRPITERVLDGKSKRYLIRSACPGGFSTPEGIDKTLSIIASIKGVSSISEGTDSRGMLYTITLNKSTTAQAAKSIFDEIDRVLLKSESYDLGFTARSVNNVTFFRTNIPKLLIRWARWRVALEKHVLANLANKEKEKLAKLKLIAKAISNIDIIADALKAQDPESFLMGKLNITAEQANYIRDLKFRQLERQDLNTVKTKIMDCINTVKQYGLDYKSPCNRIVTNLCEIENKTMSLTKQTPSRKTKSNKHKSSVIAGTVSTPA